MTFEHSPHECKQIPRENRFLFFPFFTLQGTTVCRTAALGATIILLFASRACYNLSVLVLSQHHHVESFDFDWYNVSDQVLVQCFDSILHFSTLPRVLLLHSLFTGFLPDKSIRFHKAALYFVYRLTCIMNSATGATWPLASSSSSGSCSQAVCSSSSSEFAGPLRRSLKYY